MQAIDRKLLRDFQRLWIQAVAIALVLACGVAILLTSVGIYNALSETRTAYYERNRFADVFAHATRAPLSLLEEIAKIDGVMGVEGRVAGDAILDIPGRARSAVGRILSFPETADPVLNVPILVTGRYPDPLKPDEVMVNAPFAQANRFEPGDAFSANLQGQKRTLRIVGTVQSPEFIYTIGPGALMPDDAAFGIIWMSERTAAAAFDMTGAFNDVTLAGLAGLATTSLGAAQAALRAARLAPAIAMQPTAPPRFKRSIIDDAMARMRLAQSTVMILRSLLRWPVRSFLTSLGLALAVASVIAATFINDALDEIVDLAFYQTNRQDAMLLFAQDVPEAAVEAVRALPGVLQAEPQQFHAATLRRGHLSKRVAIESRRPGNDLSRILDAERQPFDVPPGGIVLSDRLASHLEVQAGDRIEVAFLSGRRETFDMPVSATVELHFGLGAYMDFEDMNALFRHAPRVSTVNVTLDDARIEALHAAIKETPKISGIVEMNENRRSFQDTIEQNITVMNTIYIAIAVLITVGVTYNAVRIQLSERARELASLRILGFGRGEVSYILIGEMMLIALIAQPLGWGIGAGIAYLMTESFSSDLYAVPLVLKPATFSLASFVVLAAALASVLIVRRRLDRLDLVSVMKTRE